MKNNTPLRTQDQTVIDLAALANAPQLKAAVAADALAVLPAALATAEADGVDQQPLAAAAPAEDVIVLAQAAPAAASGDNRSAAAAPAAAKSEEKDDNGAAVASGDDDQGGWLWAALGLGVLAAAGGGNSKPSTVIDDEDDEEPQPVELNLTNDDGSVLKFDGSVFENKGLVKLLAVSDDEPYSENMTIDLPGDEAYVHDESVDKTELVADGGFSVVAGFLSDDGKQFTVLAPDAILDEGQQAELDLLLIWDPVSNANGDYGLVFENVLSESDSGGFFIEGYKYSFAMEEGAFSSSVVSA